MHRIRMFAIAAVACCAACTPTGDPPERKPPEPQATQMRDAIQAPIERAKAVKDTMQQADEAQRSRIEAVTD
ncbi:MAG: hypothetical protein NVV60_08600 [Luteimonas sp.]|nr:hypothetical protein [Luteimonas sp.]